MTNKIKKYQHQLEDIKNDNFILNIGRLHPHYKISYIKSHKSFQ